MSRALHRAWAYMSAAGLRTVVVDLRMVEIPARHDVEWFPQVVAATGPHGPRLGTFGPLADLVWQAAVDAGTATGPVLLAATGGPPRRVVVEPCACDPDEEPCGACLGQRVVYWPKDGAA